MRTITKIELTKKLLIVARPTEVLWGPIFLTSTNLIIVVKIINIKKKANPPIKYFLLFFITSLPKKSLQYLNKYYNIFIT